MPRTKTFAVLGCGMQGTAAAYDLSRHTNPERVLLLDASVDQACRTAERVKKLTGFDRFETRAVDALSPEGLAEALHGVDVLLSCVPYWMHPTVARAAIASGTSMCDLGGNTEITHQTLALDNEARAAGVSLVPDCGLAPGLVNSLGLYLMESMPDAESVQLYCGVLPQNPKPPFGYKLTFNVEGLVTEYDYEAVALRDGEIRRIETLTELETLDIPELGTMEAFVTSGGTSTAPYTFQGRVRDYAYKTLRFPGHCERMRLYKDFGLWREDEIEVRGVKVRPKDVFCRVFGEELAKVEDLDQCAIRGVAQGPSGSLTADLFVRQDEATGFTAMEQLTGFSLAIVADHLAEGDLAPGAHRYETAMSGTDFMAALARRGIQPRLTKGE
ncbi:saccharopine dehydrogenase C-terminal domain-containing protein [soil metagenome]